MKKILVIVLLMASLSVRAQQDPLYAQYINNTFLINPAYAGFTNDLNVAASYRMQWAGFEGSPKTLNANTHMSLNEKMGAGLIFVSDQIGANSISEVFLTYAYRIKFDDSKTLSFGLQAGASNYQTDNNKLNPRDANDALFTGTVSEWKPGVGAGMIFSSDRFFLSLSVPRMLKASVEQAGRQTTLYEQHFYGMASYQFQLADRVNFKPSVLVKYVSGASVSTDVNATFIFHNRYQAGLLTRSFNTYGFLLQAVVRDFRLGYVFEVPTSESVGTNFITHEITLGLRINALEHHDKNSIVSF